MIRWSFRPGSCTGYRIGIGDRLDYKFYRKDKDSKVWWAYVEGYKGIHIFSFDRKKTFNLFRDYSYKLTEEEKRMFDECEPFWARFFNNRTKG